MKVSILNYGSFWADGGAMFGAVPKRAWSRKYPADEENRCLLSISGLLVQTEGRVIVTDCGVGHKPDKRLAYYNWEENRPISVALAEHGIRPEEVTDVIFSHLHFDHCGGATELNAVGEIIPVFPQARHWTSARQWHHAASPSLLEADSFFSNNTEVLWNKGLIRLIEEETTLCDGVNLYLMDGHTPGQIVPMFKADNQTVIFCGDVIPISAHRSAVWISAYDIEPVRSLSAKQRILTMAKEHGAELIFCHDAYHPSKGGL